MSAGDVALRLLNEAPQPVRDPGRDSLGDQQVLQQFLVRERGHPIDLGRVVDGLVLRKPCRVQRIRFEVASKALSVAATTPRARLDLFDVVGQEVGDVALEPRVARAAAQVQRRMREPASHSQLDVAAKVGGIGRNAQVLACQERVEERRPVQTPELLSDRHRTHPDAREAASAGPHLMLELGVDGSCYEESART